MTDEEYKQPQHSHSASAGKISERLNRNKLAKWRIKEIDDRQDDFSDDGDCFVGHLSEGEKVKGIKG